MEVLETRNVFIMRCGIALTKEYISWTCATGISRRPTGSKLTGAHIYYDRDLAHYKAFNSVGGSEVSTLAGT